MSVRLLQDDKTADVASDTTLVLPSDGRYTNVTGTTTITGIDDVDTAGATIGEGQTRVIRFAGAAPLTHHGTSFILMGGASRTSVAGDVSTFLHLGSGNWQEIGRNGASYPFASQAEAEAGEVENKAMNPLRTAQAIAALAEGGGSESSAASLLYAYNNLV